MIQDFFFYHLQLKHEGVPRLEDLFVTRKLLLQPLGREEDQTRSHCEVFDSIPAHCCIWRETLLLDSIKEPLLAPKRHTHSRLRCSNLLEDKQKRLTLNGCCAHPLQAGIITLTGWDTAKKRTTWVKLLQVVYLLSLILPYSERVFMRAEACLSLVCLCC